MFSKLEYIMYFFFLDLCEDFLLECSILIITINNAVLLGVIIDNNA